MVLHISHDKGHVLLLLLVTSQSLWADVGLWAARIKLGCNFIILYFVNIHYVGHKYTVQSPIILYVCLVSFSHVITPLKMFPVKGSAMVTSLSASIKDACGKPSPQEQSLSC